MASMSVAQRLKAMKKTNPADDEAAEKRAGVESAAEDAAEQPKKGVPPQFRRKAKGKRTGLKTYRGQVK